LSLKKRLTVGKNCLLSDENTTGAKNVIRVLEAKPQIRGESKPL